MARNHAGEQKGSLGKKRVEMKMEDRISELPNDVLLYILSFLPMYQVVRTSILSRSWRHLWTQVPVLDFGTHEPHFTQLGIESVVNCCLMLYNAPKIKQFRARIDHTCILHHNLDAWLRFALQHNVEELDMDYITGNRRDNEHNLILYVMPRCLFHCGTLRALRLRGCELKLPASFCLGSLRTLELYQDMDLKEPILGNSPLGTTCLELNTSLNRWEIRGMTQLLIRSHYLETLIVDIQKMIGYVTRNMVESEGWEMLELAMSSLLHLKTVRIYNLFRITTIVSFSGESRTLINQILMICEKEIKLLKAVLKSCKMLDRMFISAINTQDPTKWMLISELLLILTEELQSFPRVSANAEIYLS
ncbi:F-box/FBD/LRR-repeat protein At2g04230 [Elaeis guineensis]|uniref:F-box/FBD/LRR-repeat protein At2g04230 n=1 Tax=Elaeis guineensis var. tenera TaxID=51953 RepID=A0A6I9S3G5_ELAGV|nr:F-box/FBD/LRR-repeat protein At2g04230 [Elaeis guineensis]